MQDFGQLSDYDFEQLVADLLGAQWGVRVEYFPRGRDSGVPFGWNCNHQHTALYQPEFERQRADLRKNHGPFIQWVEFVHDASAVFR